MTPHHTRTRRKGALELQIRGRNVEINDQIRSHLAQKLGQLNRQLTGLARAAGETEVNAGNNVWVNADLLMTHDVCGPGTIGVFKREFGEDARVWDANKIVIIPDHYIFTSDSLSNRNVDILREFAKAQGLQYFYDVIDDEDGKWKFDASQGLLKRQ